MKIKYIFLLFSFFIFHFSFSQSWLWGKYGKGYGSGMYVATDRQGNGYLSGFCFNRDTLDFSGYVLISSPLGGHDESSRYIIKYNNAGTLQWGTQIATYGNITNGGFTVDNWDNSYISATYGDTAIIGRDTLISEQDYYLTKYSPNGNLIWASSPTLYNNDTNEIASNCVCMDNEGNAFVTGLFTADTIHFRGISMYGNSHAALPFLVKYDSNGNVLWTSTATVINKHGEGVGTGIVTDKRGNICEVGSYGDTIVFGRDSLFDILSSYAGFYIVKYDSSGNVKWARQATIPTVTSGFAFVGDYVTTDLSGNIYATGHFFDTVMFGANVLIGPSKYKEQASIFLVKYDSSGNLLWAKAATVLDNNGWGVGGISSDAHNHIYLSIGGGVGNSKIVFSGDTLSIDDTAKYDAAGIIYKLDSNGNVLCSSITSGGGNDFIDVASDTSGNYVYMGGTAWSEVLFGDDTVNPYTYHNVLSSINSAPFIARWEECEPILAGMPVITPPNSIDAKVYPSPSNGQFTLVIASEAKQSPITVEIYNVLGEKVYSRSAQADDNSNIINLTEQPNGVYLYRVLSENGDLIGEGKVVIQK